MVNKKIMIFIFGIIIGIIISGSIVYAVNVASSSVSYNNSGSSVTNVEEALNELYLKEENANYIRFSRNSKKVFGIGSGTSRAICINRNGIISCFGINNYAVEKAHLEQVLSDGWVDVHDDAVGFYASDFNCNVYTSGRVYCIDSIAVSDCNINGDGTGTC